MIFRYVACSTCGSLVAIEKLAMTAADDDAGVTVTPVIDGREAHLKWRAARGEHG